VPALHTCILEIFFHSATVQNNPNSKKQINNENEITKGLMDENYFKQYIIITLRIGERYSLIFVAPKLMQVIFLFAHFLFIIYKLHH